MLLHVHMAEAARCRRVWWQGRAWSIQPPRSLALATVADMASRRTAGGQLMMTSSHTLPRPGSPR